VTYHGPGQLVSYPLFDLNRLNLGLRSFVQKLERVLISVLAHYDIKAQGKAGAPGVYVDDAKIGSIGLRVRKGRSYHGISLNVAMELEPFSRINPCGFSGLAMTQISDFVKTVQMRDVVGLWQRELLESFDMHQVLAHEFN